MNNLRDDERRLAEAEQRMTPGPWQVVYDKNHHSENQHSETIVWGPKGPGYGAMAETSPHVMASDENVVDAHGIALCRNMAPVLLERIEELAGLLKKFVDIEEGTDTDTLDTTNLCNQAARLLEGRGK